MSKVLFIVPFFPYPLDSGGCQAIYSGIVAAITAGADVFLVYPDRDNSEENRIALSDKLGGKIQLFPFPMYNDKKGEKVLNFIYRVKYQIKKLIKGEVSHKAAETPYREWIMQMTPQAENYCRYVNALIEQNNIDTVQCEMLDTLAFGLTLPKGVKKYFVHHELGFVRKSQHPIVKQDTVAAPAHLRINQLVEIDLLNRFDTVITLSETDTIKLQDAGVTSHLFTSFATIAHRPESSLETTSGTVLSFVGPEWHPSNKPGLEWFLDSCWETLLARKPDYKLQIIGGWSKDTCQEWSAKYRNVVFTGFVDNLADAIKNTVMIVPITIGSGIRMKILEAALIGVPFVTTSIGVDGLPLVNGENCFIDDTPNGFAKGIMALSDQSIRDRFIRTSQQIIAEKYSQQSLNENRRMLYQ